MKRALVLGIGGQDGSFLAEILLEQGWEVHGMHRHSSCGNLRRVEHLRDRITLHQGDLLDFVSLIETFDKSDPDVVFNEADQDHVRYSIKVPLYSTLVTYGGVANVLEICRIFRKGIKLFQPLSATMFGSQAAAPQDESTPLNPDSPYACAKAGAWHLCRHYRREHGLDVRCAIMYNHDSPRRGGDYLLQRIARGEKIDGDLSTVVDVGYAREYMEAAVKIMELPPPPQNEFFQHDYVMGTQRAYQIGELLTDHACRNVVQADRCLTPDCTKLRNSIGWNPQHDARSVLRMIKEARGGKHEAAGSSQDAG